MEYQLIEPRIPLKMQLSAVEQVLTNRGIALAEINHYLNTTDDDILSNELIANIKEGAKMLISHIANEDDIFIQIDSDCDGYTSSATLINYLNCLFPAYVRNHIYYRIHEGKQHGLIPETIPNNIKLAIAPDSSSNDYEEHKILKERGIDVLVIDHHEADMISPNACVINNQLCDYPTKSLSGVGMVYKFCSYIDELLNVDYAEQFLDLVALGMIADMIDLRDFETKHLINKGLAHIRNPYFRGMVDKQSFQLKDGLTPFGIAFYIAPYVNATIRVGTQEEKLILFESMLDFKAYDEIPSTKRGAKGQMETRVEQACRNSTNIKNRQNKARDASLETIERLIAEQKLLDNKILVVKLDGYTVDKNLTGLVANQLMAKYQRPVLILNKVVNDKTISWEGSGRGYDKSKFDNLREFLKNSNLVMYAEGHNNALGSGILDENFDAFIEYVNTELADFNFTTSYKVDFIFTGNDIRPNDILELAELKPIWGQGVEEPLIAIQKINIPKDNIKLLSPDKNPTLKLSLKNGIDLIKFKSSQEEYENLIETGSVIIDVVGRCERNVWNGNITPQIIVEEYQIISKLHYF